MPIQIMTADDSSSVMQMFSKLEFIFCAFLTENNFVNVLILFTRVRVLG
jgi:hypothetical protein